MDFLLRAMIIFIPIKKYIGPNISHLSTNHGSAQKSSTNHVKDDLWSWAFQKKEWSDNGHFLLLCVMIMSLRGWLIGSKKPKTPIGNVH